MKRFLPLLLTAFLTACGLTPNQIKALDGVMYNKTKGYGVESTTILIGGASKAGTYVINGESGSIATQGGGK
jgi:hypothetical protein